jgi:hypothetical protein
MAKSRGEPDKGGQAEEALREYFAENGSFVLRGIPVRSGTEDVTDVDLWVYGRPNAYSRHITIVDIKNKRRGKPFERAIWVKGLQTMLRADEAILATQGAKPSVYEFAAKSDVRVISGPIFDAVVKRFSAARERISAEQADHEWKNTNIDRKSLKTIIDDAKSNISDGITFSALNRWVDQAAELLRLAVERERHPGPITRGAYLMCALVAIGADFLGREKALSEAPQRKAYFKSGLLFGSSEKSTGNSFLDFAESVVTEFADPTGGIAAQIRTGFDKAVLSMPIDGLIEFFSRAGSGAQLHKGAFGLEKECYSINLKHPSKIDSLEAKIIIGLISDYAGVARKDILGEQMLSVEPEEEEQGSLPL